MAAESTLVFDACAVIAMLRGESGAETVASLSWRDGGELGGADEGDRRGRQAREGAARHRQRHEGAEDRPDRGDVVVGGAAVPRSNSSHR